LNLEQAGWSNIWKNQFLRCLKDNCQPARVASENRGTYKVITEGGERIAEVSGHFRHISGSRSDFPAVGDWVALEMPDMLSHCLIHEILPRFSSFVRKSAGTAVEEQVVAANVDTVFIVSGLDHDFNTRRIERYLTLAYESGAAPVILLNKTDIAPDPENACIETENIAYGVPVLAISALNSTGMDKLWQYLKPGTTSVLLGSSGVGKSSLVNALLETEILKTNEVRKDDSHGRHTTTSRQLIALPNGALIIDTPGMRELQLLADNSSLEKSFDEIAGLAKMCSFRDCTHIVEPGCAVLAALQTGELSAERYESYLKLQKEIRHHQIEQDIHLQKKEKNRWKAIHKSLQQHHHKYKK
jgi:ribosome biogenesis GTPase